MGGNAADVRRTGAVAGVLGLGGALYGVDRGAGGAEGAEGAGGAGTFVGCGVCN